MLPWSPASVADLPGEGPEGVQRGGPVPGLHAHAADVQGTLEVGGRVMFCQEQLHLLTNMIQDWQLQQGAAPGTPGQGRAGWRGSRGRQGVPL